MKRGYLIAGIAAMVVVTILVPGVSAGFLERSVLPAGDSTYRIILSIPRETVAGITETLPSGMEILEVSLPPDQYHAEETTLYLAVIGEREITYVVKGPIHPAGAIHGTWTDYIAGETGMVSGGVDNTTSHTGAPDTSGTPRAGASLLPVLAGTGLVFAGAALSRKRGRDES